MLTEELDVLFVVDVVDVVFVFGALQFLREVLNKARRGFVIATLRQHDNASDTADFFLDILQRPHAGVVIWNQSRDVGLQPVYKPVHKKAAEDCYQPCNQNHRQVTSAAESCQRHQALAKTEPPLNLRHLLPVLHQRVCP